MRWHSRVALYYHTARHLRPAQILHRTRNLFASFLPFRPGALDVEGEPFKLCSRAWPVEAMLSRRSADGVLERAEQVSVGRFAFVGETAEITTLEDWHPSTFSRLWRFHLHYFDYAFDLAVAWKKTGSASYYAVFRKLVLSWLKHNAVQSGDAWHPYPTSLRAVNWGLACLLFDPLLAEDADLRRKLLGALHAQGAFLSKNMEYDLLANHLFKNITAFFVLGRLFADDAALIWRKKADRLLKRELLEQVLPDGCHFERSPMYQCVVLQDLLDCLSFLEPEEQELRGLLEGTAQRMLSFLESILYTDGTFPLFNDAALNMAPRPDELRAYAGQVMGAAPHVPEEGCGQEEAGIVHHRESGYVVMDRPEGRLVVDGGKLGPDYQLGHAHCDLFSFELAIEGALVIVDSGTPTYEEGSLRMRCRSTQAHNTVMVDGQEQAEIWKSFRVGRRPTPREVEAWRSDGVLCFHGWHDGYKRLRGCPAHRRHLYLLEGPVLVVFDSLDGRGQHQAESFVHLHPAVEMDEDTMMLHRDATVLRFAPLQGSSVELIDWFYAPEMGATQESKVLKISSSGEAPLHVGYVIAPREAQGLGLSFDKARQCLELRRHDHLQRILPVGSYATQLGRAHG